MFCKPNNKFVNKERELSNYIENVIRTIGAAELKPFIEGYKQILSHLYQNSNSYTNLVMLAGYAGLFTIWQLSRDLLSVRAAKIVGFLMTGSLIIFVGYEVIKMISQALFFRKLGRILEKDIEAADKVMAWEIAFARFSNNQLKVWPYFLIPTIMLGFLAGIILLYQFMSGH